MYGFVNRVSRIVSSSAKNFYGTASWSSYLTKRCFISYSLPTGLQKSRRCSIPDDFVKWGSLGLYRKSSFATGFAPLKPKPLGSIIDIGRAEMQSPEDLAAIWDDVIFLPYFLDYCYY